MAVGQITWENFITNNNDARGVRYKFEDLSRQLFTYEFLSQNNKIAHIGLIHWRNLSVFS